MAILQWESGRKYGYCFADVAITEEAHYIVDRNPERDGWVGVVFALNKGQHRRQFFDNKKDAVAYCNKIKIEHG